MASGTGQAGMQGVWEGEMREMWSGVGVQKSLQWEDRELSTLTLAAVIYAINIDRYLLTTSGHLPHSPASHLAVENMKKEYLV